MMSILLINREINSVVECAPYKCEVTGSSPVSPTRGISLVVKRMLCKHLSPVRLWYSPLARMAELVNAIGLGPIVIRLTGSSPVSGT